MSNVTVAICTYMECKNIQPCIMSFLNADPRINEVIVIDDGSTDKTKAKAKALNDSRVHFYIKNLNKYHRGKDDSLYLAAQFASNETMLCVDCDTVAIDLKDALDKMDMGYDLVAIRIGIIENGSLLAKCEGLEYKTVMNHIKPWYMEKLNILLNVSGAAFCIRKQLILEITSLIQLLEKISHIV